MSETRELYSPMPKVNFYGVNLGAPWNQQLGSMDWGNTELGKLNSVNSEVYLEPLSRSQSVGAEYAWQVVGAYWSVEDTTMTRFRAYNIDGSFVGQAIYGVSWVGATNTVKPGGLHWYPNASSYYIPVDNQINTPNTGGYEVCVLEYNHPSETMHFGMDKHDEQHRTLIINFQLLPIAEEYPAR